MRILFLSSDDPKDKKSWSGTLNSFFNVLEKNNEVIWSGKCEPIILKYLLYIPKVLLKVFGKRFIITHTKLYSFFTSRKVELLLKKEEFDLIFAPGASVQIAYLRTNIPIIYLSDATFCAMTNYYHSHENLICRNIQSGNDIERRALSKAKHIIMASEWALKSAINDYNIDEKKISILEFGPNLKKIPKREDIKIGDKEIITLLFLGVDWTRKGGDKVVKAFKHLEKKGLKLKLYIVGCNAECISENIEVIEFIDKNDNKQLERLYGILHKTDILVLPTIAECAGIVYCEASAFGIPIITNDTGGVPNYVINNYNGYRLNVKSDYIDYASKIEELYNDRKKLINMSNNSRDLYEKKLNWNIWGKEIDKIIKNLLCNS